MAYKQKHKYGYRDSLEKGDPEKVIYGQQFDDEFEAIEQALLAIDPDSDGGVGIDEVDGLQEELDKKIEDAPSDGKQYAREDGAWTEVDIPDVDVSGLVEEAPDDGKQYVRESKAWAEAVTPGGGASSWNDLTDKPTEFPPESHNHVVADITDFDPADYQPVGDYLTEAPNDGKQYVRKSEAWAEAVTYDDSTLLATIAALEARIDTLENASGGSLWTDNGNGSISYSGVVKANDFVAE